MAYSTSWLCTYAVAQLGKPYLDDTKGESLVSRQPDLYQAGYIRTVKSFPNPYFGLEVKHHSSSGLIVGAYACSSVDGEPDHMTTIKNDPATIFNEYCSPRSRNMAHFDFIPGSLVFCGQGNKITHVGIYVGNIIDLNGGIHVNAVVDAFGRNFGVFIASVTEGRWFAWGRLKGCEVDTKVGHRFDARRIVNGEVVEETVEQITTLPEIKPEATKPFVATVQAGYNPTIDYAKLKNARVSAMMFYGGQLFTASHQRQTYINGYLANQIKQCNDAGMPYALYVNVRSQSVIEADEECRALYYLVSRYSPKLGVWLSLQTGASKAVNDAILEVYYKYISRWGLRARCGLYVTQAQLDTITWTAFEERFYLWMIADMNVSEVDDELLQPSMFEVPD